MQAVRGRVGAVFVAPAVLLGSAALWLRFNAEPSGFGKQFPSDLVNYFYPLAVLAAQRLGSGELPLWNPHACSGIPLLATAQVGVFYPGNWLSLLLPPDRALPLRLFIECYLGGLFTALLLRRWGLHTIACTTGGILFVFACLLGQTFWPPQVSTIIWLPWTLLCVEALSRQWRWRWWLGLAAGIALQLVAGFAQYAAYTFCVVVPYAVVRLALVERATGSALARAGGILAALGLGIGLAGAQLLPTLELIALGLRSGPLGPGDAHYLSRMQLGGPGLWFLANALDPSPKLASFDFRYGSGYVGIATLVLASLGLAVGRPRHLAWLLLAGGALSLLLSFGYRGAVPGLYEFYASLPVAGWFRTPERFRVLYFSALIGLAALGLDSAARPGARRSVALAVTAGAAAAIAILGGVPAAWRAGVAFALVAASVLVRSPAVVPPACAAVLALFVVADVLHATDVQGSMRRLPKEWSQTYHFLGAGVVDGDTLARVQREAGLGRVEILDVLPLNPAPPIAEAYRISCYEPLAPDPWPRLVRRIGGRPEWGMLLFHLRPERYAALYDVAGVTTVLEPSAVESRRPEVQPRWRRGLGPRPPERGQAARRWSNEDALPRAYVADRFVVRETSVALDHVLRGDLDFRRLVILDRDPGFESGAPAAAPFRAAAIRAYAPERVEIEVRADRDAVLVLSDTFYPGWRAEVDGEETEILRANGLYRAVRVPAGVHRIVFEYRPASLRRGAASSAASLALLLAIPLAALARRNRP